jgi:uncharacterized membrane protein YkvA (DUF1232 family)
MSQRSKGQIPKVRIGLLAKAIRNLRLVWRLMGDGEVPLRAKLVPLMVLAYLVFPSDLLPDYILGVGQVDDVAVILLASKLFVSLCPSAVVQRHRRDMDAVEGEYQELEGED